jgi:hypothetical protein
MSIRPAMLAFVCALFAAPALVSGQTKPNFSGTWSRVDTDAERASVATTGDQTFRIGSPGSGWGSPLTVRHDTKALVVEYAQFSVYDLQPPIRLSFAMDGSDSRNDLMIGHTQSTQHSRLAWRDDKLVITTVIDVPELRGTPRVEVRQVLALESADTLAIETTRTGPAGTTPSVARTLYRRTGA